MVALWAAFKAVFGVKDFVLPSPLGVLRAFEADPRTFLVGVRETATSAAIGFAIAAVGGVLVGSLLSLSRAVERSVYPLTLLFQMVPLVAIAPLLAQAMHSPWWEDYAIKERFLCGGQGAVVVERNDAQASLISGNSRFTLFREAGSQPGLIFQSEAMTLTLWGDSLTLEQGRRTRQRTKTDQA